MDHRHAPPPPSRGTERLLLAIGQVSATHRTVLTPAGSAPVNAVSWSLREEPISRRAWSPRSGAAPDGPVRLVVTVSGPGWQHTERVEASGREDVAAVRAKVTQARMLALRAVVWAPTDPPRTPGGAVPTDRRPTGAVPTDRRPTGAVPTDRRPTGAALSSGASAGPLPSAPVRVLAARVRGKATEPAR